MFDYITDTYTINELKLIKTLMWTASKIRRLRKRVGMTQVRFADWLGVTSMHVSHLERGKRPAGKQTERLLDILLMQANKKARNE